MKTILTRILKKSTEQFTIPAERTVGTALKTLSKKEHSLFYTFFVLLIIGSLGLLFQVNTFFLTEQPSYGRSITEGVLGTPRFINPLLARSNADRDLTTLVYSGLLRSSSSGKLIPDLAESYTISEDGLIYEFTLKNDLRWHDGEKITSEDILFTIKKTQDSALLSPKRAAWDGVDVTAPDLNTVIFTLRQPYSPFLENTTLGILPKHIWGNVTSEQFGFSKFNTEPVGSGPYRVVGVKRDRGGIPEFYDLKQFNDFALGKPFISKLKLQFYPNEEALVKAIKSGAIDNINSISPEVARDLADKGFRVEKTPLPRVFGLFFNHNEAPIFTERLTRKALSISVDKDKIVSEILYGYATKISGPLPPGSIGYKAPPEDTLSESERLVEARELLESAGWTYDEDENMFLRGAEDSEERLSFSISTSAIPELKAVASALKDDWKKLGVDVQIKIFETGDLNQNVIRPRNFDALLFGEVIGRDNDPFAFWHSSQRLDPGLNIASYANITVDNLLEKAREEKDLEARTEMYEEFHSEIINDIPGIFLYAPDFIYVMSDKIQGMQLQNTTIPSERFLNVHEWYVNTEKVWKIFKRP